MDACNIYLSWTHACFVEEVAEQLVALLTRHLKQRGAKLYSVSQLKHTFFKQDLSKGGENCNIYIVPIRCEWQSLSSDRKSVPLGKSRLQQL